MQYAPNNNEYIVVNIVPWNCDLHPGEREEVKLHTFQNFHRINTNTHKHTHTLDKYYYISGERERWVILESDFTRSDHVEGG